MLLSHSCLRTYSAILATLTAVACSDDAPATTGTARGGGRGGGPQVSVQTVTLQRISIPRQVDLAGTLISPDQATVSSEVAGVVREVVVQLGSEVRAGDILVRLQPRELELALARAESALNQVEAQLGIDASRDLPPPPDDEVASVRQASANRDDARATFARASELHGRGLISQVDYDAAATRRKVAEANYQAAIDNVRSLKAALQDRRASHELARKKVNDASIRAPVGGSIAERLVQPGEFIRENTPVVTIVQINPLKLKTAAQEKNAALIRPGQAVTFTVEAFPGRTFNGRIAYVSPAVDQATRTFVVEAMVDNADRQLKPGFFAKGTVETRVDAGVIAASDDAISTLAGVSTVYVIADGVARQQQVTLGARQGPLVEILSGLKGDELLAVGNLSQLATGTAVAVSKADGAAAEGARGSSQGGRQ